MAASKAQCCFTCKCVYWGDVMDSLGRSLCITHKKQTGIPIFGHSFPFEALLFNLTGGMHGGM